MKALVLALVLVVVCVVLFIAGAVSPSRSRRMQDAVDRVSLNGEEKGDRRAGKLGDATETALRKSRAAADASAHKGRKLHDRIFQDEP